MFQQGRGSRREGSIRAKGKCEVRMGEREGGGRMRERREHGDLEGVKGRKVHGRKEGA